MQTHDEPVQFITVEKSEYEQLLAIRKNANELLELNKIGWDAFNEAPILKYTQKNMWNDIEFTHNLLNKILTDK